MADSPRCSSVVGGFRLQGLDMRSASVYSGRGGASHRQDRLLREVQARKNLRVTTQITTLLVLLVDLAQPILTGNNNNDTSK